MDYDVIVIGAGPGGIYATYELTRENPGLRIAVFEAGKELKRRKCPIDGDKVKTCIGCPSCSIMSGCGGAGAFSDGKYNTTNRFGGTLYEYIGKDKALELMRYVDEVNLAHGGAGTKLYSTADTSIKRMCMEHKLKLLDASVRHLGTDINYVVLENLYAELKERADFRFLTPVERVELIEGGYRVDTAHGSFSCERCIVSAGRPGRTWMEDVCHELDVENEYTRVDIGGRVKRPAERLGDRIDDGQGSKTK